MVTKSLPANGLPWGESFDEALFYWEKHPSPGACSSEEIMRLSSLAKKEGWRMYAVNNTYICFYHIRTFKLSMLFFPLNSAGHVHFLHKEELITVCDGKEYLVSGSNSYLLEYLI